LRETVERTDHGIQRFFSRAKAEKDFEKLSLDKEVRSYKAKDTIYNEGSDARWLYFIISGSVKTIQINDFGKELITHIYNTGDFFGYFPILRETPHTDSAVGLKECKLRLIPSNDFKLMLFNNRDFAAQFIKVLANDADDTEQKLIELAYSSVRRKVANALLSFTVKKDNQKTESNVLSVSRDNLAAAAGTAKETLIRTLSDFKAEGLLEIDGKFITLLDRSRLESMPQ
jgi:CRP-like cAMP-binding protein